MEEQDRLKEVKREELRREIQAGKNSGPSTAWDATAIKRKARARKRATEAA